MKNNFLTLEGEERALDVYYQCKSAVMWSSISSIYILSSQHFQNLGIFQASKSFCFILMHRKLIIISLIYYIITFSNYINVLDVRCYIVPPSPPSHLRGKKWSGSWLIRTHLLEEIFWKIYHVIDGGHFLKDYDESSIHRWELRPCQY